MGGRDLLRHRQSQSRPIGLFRDKRLEQPWRNVRGRPAACVLNHQFGAIAGSPQHDIHGRRRCANLAVVLATMASGFDTVKHQIDEHLLQGVRVAEDLQRIVGEFPF